MRAVEILFLIFFLGTAYFWFHAPFLQPAGTSELPAPIFTTFYCTNAMQMHAVFTPQTVALTLSDGRSFLLSQAISASGTRYEASTTSANIVFSNKGDNAFLTENEKTTYENCTAAHVALSDAPGYETYTDQSKTVTFALPTNFSIAGSAIGYSTDWATLATTSGQLLALIEVPREYEPGTNFGDARFTVGTSADPDAVATCLTNPSGEHAATSTVETIGSIVFTKLMFSGAGAGNYYDTTSYRTVRGGQCYAVEYTIHSMNIFNYPRGAVKAFDREKVQAALEELVHSFRFL